MQQAVHLEADGEAVRGGAGQPGALAQLGEPARLGRGRPQHPHRLVEHADTAMLSHKSILSSYDLRRPEEQPWVARCAEKVWDSHLVRKGRDGEPDLLYIDLHLVHEVTSPQAFDGLRLAGRPVRRPDLTLATEDHNVPTLDVLAPIADPVSRTQVETLRRNCAEFGVTLYPMNHAEQGIVHVVGPQLGLTQPGMTVVCGDSHTSTHGAFGAMAFGIGTSEVEHVLATQTLPLKPFKTMAITVTSQDGRLRPGVTSKDVILAIIAQIGTGGGQGYVLEYRGNVIENLSMEARMTICNMSIEAGARAGMIAPDDTTFEYLQRPRPRARRAPTGTRPSPSGASCHRRRRGVRRRGGHRRRHAHPVRHLGHQPGPGPAARRERVPDPELIVDENERVAAEKALAYMGLDRRHPAARHPRRHRVRRLLHQRPHRGPAGGRRRSSTGRQVADGVRMLVVPGSMRVRFQAEDEGLDKVFTAAGAEWRSAGCSMCLGMNPDQLAPGERSRVDVEPQLRGPPGQGWPHPPRLAAGGRRHRRPRHPVQPGGPGLKEGTMEKFTTHTGIGVPLRRSNVDTDQIIPAVYLKRVTRTGFEDGLFSAWRSDPSFVLNTEPFTRGSVLVAGPDFGTGRSREHAVWALMDYGFRVVISSALRATSSAATPPRAGLLAAQVAQPDVELLWKLLENEPGTEVTVDLAERPCRPRTSPCPSTSTTTPAGACWRASTTSG